MKPTDKSLLCKDLPAGRLVFRLSTGFGSALAFFSAKGGFPDPLQVPCGANLGVLAAAAEADQTGESTQGDRTGGGGDDEGAAAGHRIVGPNAAQAHRRAIQHFLENREREWPGAKEALVKKYLASL